MFQSWFIVLFTLPFAFCQYHILFDADYSPPPIIPLDAKDYYYSVPLNQMVSKPIIIYIQFLNGTRVNNNKVASETFEVSTVDAKRAYSSRYPDTWASSGGKLCQKSAWWLDYPDRLNRKFHKVRCGSDISQTTLLVPAFNGKIILDWIYHKHNVVPENKRVLRVVLSNRFLKAESNAFLITEPAHHLTITQQPPKSVNANDDFTIVAEVRYKNDSVVTTGLDSVVNVDLTVPYYLKKFSNTLSRRMLLKSSPYRLSGKGIILHQGNYDWVIRKQAVKGKVIFDDVRILDPATKLKLNLTMTRIRDPWLRIPNCEQCYDDLSRIIISADGTDVTFEEPDTYLMNKLLAVKLTRVFDVIEQKLYKLSFTDETNKYFQENINPVTKLFPLTRNIKIPGKISVTANDKYKRRIYSGTDSQFKLIYKTIPKSVCISSDATKEITGGFGEIILSVCQIIDNVTIEIIPNNRQNSSIFTPYFKVDGILNIGHFGDFRFSGDGPQVQSHTNSFIRFAAYDINSGRMMPYLSKQGFLFNILTFETKSDIHLAYEALMTIETNPKVKRKTMLIISSTSEAITKSVSAELWQLGAALFSTSNTAYSFSNKENYPLFNRVCLSEMQIFKSVLLACKSRRWSNIIIVKEETISFSEFYFDTANDLGIKIKAIIDVDISSFDPGEPVDLKYEMGMVKSFGIKIIVLFATRSTQPFIIRAAQMANLDSSYGYQWILFGKYSWQFPFSNAGVCNIGIPCTKAFKSTYLFSETYNISGYNTEDWVRVLGYHFAVDRFLYKGGRVKYRPPEVGAKMALGYDAVLLYANTIERIVSKRETLSHIKIAKYSRGYSIKGLTGNLELDINGDRIGFFGFLAQVNPFKEDNYRAHISMMVTFTRSLIHVSEEEQLEIPYIAWRPGTDPKDPRSKAILPVSPKYNIRTYESLSGMVNQLTQSIVPHPSEPWPSIPFTRTESIVPMFFCEFDCGKSLLSSADINEYDTGRCDIGGRCLCNTGFHGNFCELISCKCEYGTCISTTHCYCYHGWRGLECNIAICASCKHGKCVEPDKCRCNSRLWIGVSCDTHLALVLAPLFLGGALIVCVVSLLVRYILKHAERNKALSNTDWIVEWPYVTQYVAEEITTSKTSVSDISTLISQKEINTYLWKNEKWYGKAISSRTIDPKIAEMRLEMVELVKIRHRNLIIYGGACLTSPNVCLFLEVADKGSLNDILLNDSIDLGWEFKFSFMKDICSGMRFLHEKTSIGSHGRLKSHNCLIDSRWTVRISGFGAHTIRFGRFRLPGELKEDIKQLFWTPPELLENVTSLDDVKYGTVSGDSYSFSIVVTEIITRAEPYDYELEFISDKAILDMITDTDTRERKEATKIWEEIGGSDMFVCRPIIKDEYLPESGLQKKQFLKMLDDTWNESPSGRPTFERIGSNLNQIHPVKGELIDNLINLLESYSTNLEMIVVERTRELEVNKARAEQLLSQMLPRKVTAELKHGRKVPPEIFPTATVFFSDIVDFASICQESSPFQIVDFLNETYNAFDEVLDTYDVYKVETISDSYMVVSGVPERNGLQHASEIATMALNLMSTVTTFQIPHKPKATLQLRVGINSGPVVAGVVGMLMPRYCLFGDTVNTASRMESSSQALRIQLSESTAEILDELGGFHMESRGKREVKGRGLMSTYWLWGKDNFDMPLPDQSLALSLSQHKFK